MKHVLFVCGKARMRSPTAADIASSWPNVVADFAGLSRDADEQLSSEQINRADVIAVIVPRQKKRLMSVYGKLVGQKKVVVLNIPNRFEYGDPELVSRLTPATRNLLN